MSFKDHDWQCRSLTKKGKRCQAAATAGGLCFLHANPAKAAELGRIGGKKNRKFTEPSEPFPALESAQAVGDAVDSLIGDTRSGRLSPRVGSTVGSLLNLKLRAIEGTHFEQRIGAMEEGLAKLQANVDQYLSHLKHPPTDSGDLSSAWRSQEAANRNFNSAQPADQENPEDSASSE